MTNRPSRIELRQQEDFGLEEFKTEEFEVYRDKIVSELQLRVPDIDVEEAEEVIDGLDTEEENETEDDIAEETEETEASEEDEQNEGTVENIQFPDDEFGEADVGESGKCLHSNCDGHANVSVKCDTRQVKHYCDDHYDGRCAGPALIVEEKRLTELRSDSDSTDEEPEEVTSVAEPTPEHIVEVGYYIAAGQAQQIEAQRLFADNEGD